MSEDVNYFEEHIARDPLNHKKATNKKFKKITSLSAAVDGASDADDFLLRRVLRNTLPPRPPFGKTWIKQLFSGRVGLSLLFVLAGMAVASTFGMEPGASLNAPGRRQLARDMKVEDPYVTYVVLEEMGRDFATDLPITPAR